MYVKVDCLIPRDPYHPPLNPAEVACGGGWISSYLYVRHHERLGQGLGLRGNIMVINCGVLDPVYTVPDPLGHDIKLNSFKTGVALETVVILYNHRKNGRSKNNHKLTEIIVVTM
jgi:hypothetical protein